MRMFVARLQFEEIDDVDESDSEVRETLPEKSRRSQSFLSRDIPGSRKDNVGFVTFIIAGPTPDTNALCAMADCSIHVQVLQMLLFVGNNDVDVIFRPQAMIGHRQQTIRIRREIDSSDSGAFVEHYIQKSRILVREAIVILTPHG